MWIFGSKGPSGFSGRCTAEEVTQGIDGIGLTAIVTGASSGIGAETARVLALRGVHVIMAVRNLEAGRAVRQEILKKIATAKIDIMELDLSSLASVRKFASNYISLALPLNLLINNAGIFSPPFTLSQDGIEMQFASNHLGHFVLTNLLLETMKSSSEESGKEGRIVNVSSEAHRWFAPKEGIRFDKINDESSYRKMAAYGQSKLANILHAKKLARILKEEGANITSNSIHPGCVSTNIVRNPGLLYDIHRMIEKYVISYVLKTPQQGASTQCYVALHPELKGVSGEYFADSNKCHTNSLAKDIDLANKLWDFSFSLIAPK